MHGEGVAAPTENITELAEVLMTGGGGVQGGGQFGHHCRVVFETGDGLTRVPQCVFRATV